jgi:hypothetical protein
MLSIRHEIELATFSAVVQLALLLPDLESTQSAAGFPATPDEATGTRPAGTSDGPWAAQGSSDGGWYAGTG